MSKEGSILYRGSRDQLNEMCREKDEEIALLKEKIRKAIAALNVLSIQENAIFLALEYLEE